MLHATQLNAGAEKFFYLSGGKTTVGTSPAVTVYKYWATAYDLPHY